MARTRPRTGTDHAHPPADSHAGTESREDRLEALHKQLADGVAAIRDGTAWRAWLDVAARFHHYSFGNQVLISAQNPDATLVAGYRAWQGMGRHVRKGEKAIWVLAPVTSRRRPDTQPVDADELTAPATAGSDADQASVRADWSRGRVLGFRVAAVFDVAQTDGEPLPTPPHAELLAGQAPPGLWDALAESIANLGFTLTRCPDAAAIGGANGITDFSTRTVTVRADIDDAQAVKTLAHEAGHVLLHDPGDPAAPVLTCRGLVEVEAESIAYLVAAHHGLDTSGYTFAYIAGWAGTDANAVQGTATRVLGAARQLIDATAPATTTQPESATSDLAAVSETSRASAATAVAPRPADVSAGWTHTSVPADTKERLDPLREILHSAQDWFLRQATDSSVYAAAVAARGHPVQATLAFGVGYAPPTWTGLVEHLRSLGHAPEALAAAGLAITSRRGTPIDRFRGRITFPIHDQLGVVGFTARDTTGNPDIPKYLNTPTTALYDKGRLLFGTQHLPISDIESQTEIVLTEGPWDALSVTASTGGQAVGVAACGTAITDAHLELLTASKRAVILAPDNDPAGITALGRTLAMLTRCGLPHPCAVLSPQGGDLADVHTSDGPGAIRFALAAAQPAGVVYAGSYLASHRVADTPEGRVVNARAAAAHLEGLTLRQRADVGALLAARGGIAVETALAIVTPVTPKAAAPAAGPLWVLAEPRSVLRQ